MSQTGNFNRYLVENWEDQSLDFPAPPEQTNICYCTVLKILQLWKTYNSAQLEQLLKSNIL